MDIVSSIVFISCPSLRTCSENLDLPSAYLKSFLCSLNLVLKFLLTVSVAAGACQFVIFKSILRDYVNHIVRRNLFGISLVIK